MPDQRPAPDAAQPRPIPTPDQLQQSRRPDGFRPAERRHARAAPAGGVLRQLEAERAHD